MTHTPQSEHNLFAKPPVNGHGSNNHREERSAKERDERKETQREERTRQYRQLMCGVSLAGRGIV
jgi:hypothetical protein